MRVTFSILFVSMLFYSCKEEPQFSDFFEKTSLLKDSINLELKMRSVQEVQTTKGGMKIYFIASELCAQSECGTCDVNASLDIFLIYETDTLQTSTIRIYRCSQDLPILYKTIPAVKRSSDPMAITSPNTAILFTT